MRVKVRPAVFMDLEGIVKVEESVWGEGIGLGSMASREILRERIALCNASPPCWFWVAESSGKIVGSFVLQPTMMSPDECTGWDMATDNGSLVGTFNSRGGFVYGVSLSVMAGAPSGTADLLVHAAHALRLWTGKGIIYACARMTGFRAAHKATGISAEQYWSLKRRDGSPKDPFLWHFNALIGFHPARLLVDGYPPDEESGGHGVLCVSTDPMTDLLSSAERLLEAGRERSKK